MTQALKSNGRWKQAEKTIRTELIRAGTGGGKNLEERARVKEGLSGKRMGAKCGQAGRKRAGVGGDMIVMGLFLFAGFISQMSLMLEMFVICFFQNSR